MLVHSCLALSEQGEVLGLLDQQVWTRSSSKHSRDETVNQRKRRRRESERWGRMADVVHKRLVGQGIGARRIHVADREGDIFELFEQLEQLGDSFVVRATYDRLTVSEPKGERRYSLAEAQNAPVVVGKTVEVAAGPGKAARTARLEVRAARVEVMPPGNRNRKGTPVWMNVVVVSEPQPPSAKQALRWNLLTREPIETALDVLRIVDIYTRRWTVEEFHMGLKTGCALEERQLESFEALSNFLAFASAIAVYALQLRTAARAAEPKPAAQVLSGVQLRLLRTAVPRLQESPSIQQALRAVATLGGFYDTSKKAKPGWRTLYAGLQVLLLQEAAYLQALEDFKNAEREAKMRE